MEYREATRKEVKIHFLLADAFKPVVEKDGVPIYPSKETFQREYKRLLEQFSTYSEFRLNRMIKAKDSTRLERYDSLDWYFGEVALEDIGPWPQMDGLDIRLTTGNLPETVDRVRRELDCPSGLKIPPNFMPKIESIIKYKDLIIPRFPIILFPGGLERGNHNHWVRTSGEVAPEDQEDWICEISRCDNDAGNSRAFAYCLSGIKEVGAYFGEAPRYAREYTRPNKP